jgi:GAF domain-containing protein
MIHDDLIQVIREFTGSIINPFDLDELLHRLMRHATQVVDAAGAGIMLATDAGDGALDFIAASEERVVEAEQHQAELEAGACFEAYSTNRIVMIEDLEQEERWPEYARRVTGLGLRSVLGVPMNAFGQTVGVINLYREAPSRWTDEDINTAEIITAMGAGYILNANQLRAQHTLSEQLHVAIESRDIIGQAKGILMARRDLDADEAFGLLRRWSQEHNVKLRELAQRLIDEHSSQRAGS